MEQLNHEETKNSTHNLSIHVIAENMKSPENVGMAFRVCEAMGVKKLHLTGNSIQPPNRKIKKASRSTVNNLPWEYSDDSLMLIRKLQNDGYFIIALEIAKTSKSIFDLKLPDPSTKIALLMGSEKDGISEESLQCANICYHIPMYGKNSSMNVVNALSIALYESIRKHIANTS